MRYGMTNEINELSRLENKSENCTYFAQIVRSVYD